MVNIYINIDNLIHNLELLQNKAQCDIMCAVKGNCYGLGFDILPYLLRYGINDMLVFSLEEANIVRKYSSDVNIYIVNTLNEDLNNMHNMGYIPIIHNLNQLVNYDNKYVLNIESGLERFGVKYQDALSYLQSKDDQNILYIMNHLPFSYNESHELNLNLIKDFQNLQTLFPNYKYSLGSSGLLYHYHKLIKQDICRIGNLLYGRPDPIFPEIKPVVTSIEFNILEIKYITKGTSIGYNHRYTATEDEYICIVDGGYMERITNESYLTYRDNNNIYNFKVIGDIFMDVHYIYIGKELPHNFSLNSKLDILPYLNTLKSTFWQHLNIMRKNIIYY